MIFETETWRLHVLLIFVIAEADEWLLSKEEEIMCEHDLENWFSEMPTPTVVVKQPVKGEVKLNGSSVYLSDLKCGTIGYLAHWDPPAILARCMIHEGCYCTAPLLGDQVQKDDLVHWLGMAPSFRSCADHEQFLPKGCYNKRQPRCK